MQKQYGTCVALLLWLVRNTTGGHAASMMEMKVDAVMYCAFQLFFFSRAHCCSLTRITINFYLHCGFLPENFTCMSGLVDCSLIFVYISIYKSVGREQ